MPIKFEDENEGKVLAIQVNGKLAKADYVFFAPIRTTRPTERKIARVVRSGRFPRLGSRRAVEDIKFDVKHFADIERPALVGDKKWQHGMAMFCKPFTKAKVRYFDHADAAKARTWLNEA